MTGIRAQILLLLALAALAEFVVADVGVLLHQLDIPEALEGLAGRQQGLAAFLRNVLLVIGSVVLAGLLPGLIRRRPRSRAFLDEAQVLISLALLGSLAVQALARSGIAMAVANVLLAGLAILGAVRIARTRENRLAGPAVALLVAASALPQVWRAGLELGGGEEASTVALIRQGADFGVLGCWALCALLLVGLPRTRMIVALACGGAAAALAALLGDEAGHLMATITGLWFTSWPGPAMIGLLGLAATGLASAVLTPRRPALALGFILLACSGFRASGAGELLIQAIAILLLGSWAEQRGGRSGDLSPLLF